MLNTRTIFRNDTDRAGEISLRVFSRLPVGSLFGDSQMKTIPLTQGKIALVDDEDYQCLSKWKWCAHRSGTEWRAIRKARRSEDRNTKIICMHRQITNAPPCLLIDHRDHNGL
jgi:hypothetical protein